MSHADGKHQAGPEEDLFSGEVVYEYSQDQAIEDGVLVSVGFIGATPMVFTRHLFECGYQDEERRRAVIEKGLALLARPVRDDSPSMRLRVIEEGRLWVIWVAGEGVTFLMPEDY